MQAFLKFFASLKLTVILLSLAMVLIYAGTCAQVDTSIHDVQKNFFHTLFFWLPLQDLVPRFAKGDRFIPGHVPFPGGYTIGALFLINLIAAHSSRFKFKWADIAILPFIGLMLLCMSLWMFEPKGLYMGGMIASGVIMLLGLALLHGKRAGVITIHLGMIMLLVGEGITSGLQQESQMQITEGSYATYSTDLHNYELAFVERGEKDDKHVVIGAALLKKGAIIKDQRIPVEVKVDDFLKNADAVHASEEPGKPTRFDEKGRPYTLKSIAPASGTQGGRVDAPGAFITLSSGGQALGSYNVWAADPGEDQSIEISGKRYEFALRFKRLYKPYQMHLIDFSFDRYTGSGVAKNYSSVVKLVDPVNNETREVKIWMNHPLCYRGETYFQADFDKRTERATVLQVMRNPGAMLPYIAILISGFGLLDHFLIMLGGFLTQSRLTPKQVFLGHIGVAGAFAAGALGYTMLGMWGIIFTGFAAVGIVLALVFKYSLKPEEIPVAKVAAPTPPAKSKNGKHASREREVRYELAPVSRWRKPAFVFPLVIVVICAGYVLSKCAPRDDKTAYNLQAFGKTPISFDGRVQPIDTLARNALKLMRGKQTAILVTGSGKDKEEEYIPAVEWLVNLLAEKPGANDYKVFRIDHPDIKSLCGLPEGEKHFSRNDLRGGWEKLIPQIMQARKAKKEDQNLSPYQTSLLELGGKVELHERLSSLDWLYIVPPGQQGNNEWLPLREVTIGGSIPIGEAGDMVTRQLAVVRDQRQEVLRAPARWLAELTLVPEKSRQVDIVRIDNPALAASLGLDPAERFYTLSQIGARGEKFNAIMEQAMAAQQQTPEQLAAIDLYHRLDGLHQLDNATRGLPNSVTEFIKLANAYRTNKPVEFNMAAAEYAKIVEAAAPKDTTRTAFEAWFNHFNPQLISMALYVFVFLLAALSWMGWSKPLARAAFWVLVFSITIHSFALIARIYMSGRPPVTNLASSAIFIGWGAAVFACILEVVFKNGIGSVCAAIVGFPTLLIADRLSLSGDTMAVLVAVLDTNVWLATHVIIITLGYAATYLAGVIGMIYLIMGVFTPNLTKDTAKTLSRMTYGVTCFAILCSFVGTILGGIWADQSWGRFWGWDPKENGAVMIVVANAIFLHARWGGLVKERGLAVLAIFGCIITTWSYFGTNMLGVGLHSYGFMSSAKFWLGFTVFCFLSLMSIGMFVPIEAWQSYRELSSSPIPIDPKTLRPPKTPVA